MKKKTSVTDVVSIKLGRLMSEKGWSIYKLSRLSGLTPNCIQVILHKNYRDIKLSTIIIFAHYFDMTAAEFLYGEEFLYENLDLDK